MAPGAGAASAFFRDTATVALVDCELTSGRRLANRAAVKSGPEANVVFRAASEKKHRTRIATAEEMPSELCGSNKDFACPLVPFHDLVFLRISFALHVSPCNS